MLGFLVDKQPLGSWFFVFVCLFLACFWLKLYRSCFYLLALIILWDV